MTTSQARRKLEVAHLHPDTIGKTKSGTWRARWGFFYAHGRSCTGFATAVQEAGFAVIGFGRVDKAFRGGASVANSSHFWVEFAEHLENRDHTSAPQSDWDRAREFSSEK